MSRASEITLFLILLQASIGFVDSIGLFDSHYLGEVSNNASYTITDLEEYRAVEEPGISDTLMLLADWTFQAFLIGIKILFTVVFVYDTLVNTFQFPALLALFIQAGIYYVYATWYAQYKSGKGWTAYE